MAQVLMELQRRKWPTLEVGPLEGWRKRDIVEAFLKRSLTGTSEPTESSALRPTNVNSATPGSSGGDGGATAQISKTFLTGVDFVVDAGITGNTMHLHSRGEAQCGDCGGGGGGGEGGEGGDADGGSGKIPGGYFKICDKPGLVLFPSMVERIVSR